MTVAVAMLCEDGSLVASDSMGASGLLANSLTKIRTCPGKPLVWTWAGSGYLGQQVGRALDLWAQGPDPETISADPHEEAERVVDVVRGAVKAALEPLLPSHDPEQATAAEFILAGRTFVAHILADLTWELAADDRLVSIGGGQYYAAAARSVMHHYIDGGMSLEQARAVTHRAIQTVCEVSSSGVSLPVQMGLVNDAGAAVLDADEVAAVGLTVDRWKVLERETLLGSYDVPRAVEPPPTLDRSGQD